MKLSLPRLPRPLLTAAIAGFVVAFAPLLATRDAVATSSDAAGDFDFYVLALSWSPTYCTTEGQGDRFQCGPGRDLAFVVHGLWPQFERGWPDFCDTDEDGPTRAQVEAILDLVPGRGLVEYEWEKHGSCTGLNGGDYLATLREAREMVEIPNVFADPRSTQTIAPFAVERAFIAANPGLPPGGVAVTCDGRLIDEVRICLTRDGLDFRACREVDADACRAPSATMPAP